MAPHTPFVGHESRLPRASMRREALLTGFAISCVLFLTCAQHAWHKQQLDQVSRLFESHLNKSHALILGKGGQQILYPNGGDSKRSDLSLVARHLTSVDDEITYVNSSLSSTSDKAEELNTVVNTLWWNLFGEARPTPAPTPAPTSVPTPVPTPAPLLRKCASVPDTVMKTLTGHDGTVYSLAADFDKQLAISGSNDALVNLWDLSSGTVVKILRGHRGRVWAVASDFDKQIAISGSADRALMVWDLATGTFLKRLTGHGSTVYAVAADFNIEIAISGSADKTLKMWHLSTGTLLKTLAGHGSTVYAVAADFNKQLAISGSADKTLKVWNLKTGTVLKTLTGHGDMVSAVAADFDKQLAISGSADETLKVWDLSTGTVLKTLTDHSGWVHAVAADFDKQLVISGLNDATLKVWDVSTGSVLKTLTGHRGRVWAVSADFNKQIAISGSNDRTLKVWRLCEDAELVATSSEAGLSERTSKILKLGTSAELAADLREKTAEVQDLHKKLDVAAKSGDAELEVVKGASAANAREGQEKVFLLERHMQKEKEAKKDIDVEAALEAVKEACHFDTGSTCSMFACSAKRSSELGSVECEGGKCICQEGYCAISGRCEQM